MSLCIVSWRDKIQYGWDSGGCTNFTCILLISFSLLEVTKITYCPFKKQTEIPVIQKQNVENKNMGPKDQKASSIHKNISLTVHTTERFHGDSEEQNGLLLYSVHWIVHHIQNNVYSAVTLDQQWKGNDECVNDKDLPGCAWHCLCQVPDLEAFQVCVYRPIHLYSMPQSRKTNAGEDTYLELWEILHIGGRAESVGTSSAAFIRHGRCRVLMEGVTLTSTECPYMVIVVKFPVTFFAWRYANTYWPCRPTPH